jgi:hypothetical protein
MRFPRRLGRWASEITLVSLLVLVTALIALEVIYRYQLVDTYLPELRTYNDPEDLAETSAKPTILVMGDSFSVGRSSYAAILRGSQSEYRVINAAVSGIGIKQAAMIVPRRVEQFSPSVFVYQVYVGNDLYDISYPVNWESVSFGRNVYWSAAQHLWSLIFLNYRLGQIGFSLRDLDPQKNIEIVAFRDRISDVHDEFSFDKYSPRTRLQFQAEPWLLENSVMVRRNREKDYEVFLRKLRDLVSRVDPQDCDIYVLVIPHCSQVSEYYLENMRTLGAKITDPKEVLSEDYPFLSRLQRYLDENDLRHVRLLDPGRVFRAQEAEGNRVYFENDPHLNVLGQSILAGFVLEELGLAE